MPLTFISALKSFDFFFFLRHSLFCMDNGYTFLNYLNTYSKKCLTTECFIFQQNPSDIPLSGIANNTYLNIWQVWYLYLFPNISFMLCSEMILKFLLFIMNLQTLLFQFENDKVCVHELISFLYLGFISNTRLRQHLLGSELCSYF